MDIIIYFFEEGHCEVVNLRELVSYNFGDCFFSAMIIHRCAK